MESLPLTDAIGWAEKRASSDQPLDQLVAAAAVAEDLSELSDQLLGHFVTRARAADCSWATIGEAFGVSRQAAHERFGSTAPTLVWPEHFAADAQAAMTQADAVMREFCHQYLGTEHVLLGILIAPDNLAATALAQLGVRRADVHEAIEQLVGYGQTPTGQCHGIAPRLKRALERTRAEAKHAGHRHARTEHLLLGLASGDGVATQILGDQGVNERALRDQIADLLPEAPEIAAAVRRGPGRRRRRRQG